jgi:hypothetical protein
MNEIVKLPNQPQSIVETGRLPRGSARQAILVLGMHRSGTSALGGVLEALGATAPKTLMPPHRENPRGFFESIALAEAHDALLASAGSCWHDWRPFDPQWIGSDIAEQHRRTIKALLIEEFGDAPLIFVKDPRICRFVPFTLSVLAELNISPVVILPLRNPLEVAASLRRNRDFALSKSLLLWLRHVLDAEYHSRHLPRYFLSYEKFLTDWRGDMDRAAKKIGVTWPARSEVSEAKIEQFLTRELRRERASVDEIRDHPEVSAMVRETYKILSEIVQRGESPALLARLDRMRTTFDEDCRMFGSMVAAEQSAAEQLRGELDRKTAETEQFGREKTSLAAELEQRSLEQHSLAEAHKVLAAERDNLSIEVNRLAMEQRSLAEAHEVLTAERDSLVGEVSRLAAERDGLVTEFNRLAAEQHSLADAYKVLAAERDSLVIEVHRLAAEQYSSAEAREAWTVERDSLVAANNGLIAAQDAILASRSWRVTAPLRSLGKLLSRRDD